MRRQEAADSPEPEGTADRGTPAPPAPPVHHPIMIHRWRQFTFLHWHYPADVVQSLLPPRVTVQTYNGLAWIGVLPFRMEGVRAPGLPALPWLSSFPETNLRTYVRGPDGHTGIWFFSLDAARLPATVGGRVGYGLPYRWSDMSIQITGTSLAYRSRRRRPGPAAGARCHVAVRTGPALAGPELTPLDHFLTARYRLYSRVAGRLVAADAEHGPWPLHRAHLTHLDQDLVEAAGLPAPDHEPLVHASPGVTVRIGRWHFV